jgi:hypothetical protein
MGVNQNQFLSGFGARAFLHSQGHKQPSRRHFGKSVLQQEPTLESGFPETSSTGRAAGSIRTTGCILLLQI